MNRSKNGRSVNDKDGGHNIYNRVQGTDLVARQKEIWYSADSKGADKIKGKYDLYTLLGDMWMFGLCAFEVVPARSFSFRVPSRDRL
jgi:hypothetical protein